MALPHKLSSLDPREAVTDARYRAINGIDQDDVALFDSALTGDATMYLFGTVLEGLDALHT